MGKIRDLIVGYYNGRGLALVDAKDVRIAVDQLEARVKVNMQSIKQLSWEKLQLEARIEELEQEVRRVNSVDQVILDSYKGKSKEDSLEEVLCKTYVLTPYVDEVAKVVRKWIKDRLDYNAYVSNVDDYIKEVKQRLGLNEGSEK